MDTTSLSNPKRPRLIQVQSWYDISPNLRRIVFHNAELSDYPFERNGAHIKIFLPLPGQTKPELPQITDRGPRWLDKETAPIKRSYTLSGFDRQACTLSIDFVLHGENGPASTFAKHVQIGQTIGITPPRDKNLFEGGVGACLLAGDLSALPAITAILADLPETTHGDVLLWLPCESDTPKTLQKPPKIKIHTFTPEHPLKALIQQFSQCRPETENARYWIAGEAAMVDSLRQIVRQQWQVPARYCYAVPFWRLGESEEQYHQSRHAFMDAMPEE